jgi:hypothetical protein
MKYFQLEKINRAIRAIRESNITQEHVSSRAASELARHYFSNEKYTMVPEQIQKGTKKRPDFIIEKFIENNPVELSFIPHTFIEVKSLVGRNIIYIVNQLHDTVVESMDEWGNITGNYSAFMIGLKGTKIAFYTYHNLSSLLDDYDIINYKGFIPLNLIIPKNLFLSLNKNSPLKEALYDRYLRGINFDTNHQSLHDKGVEGIKDIPFPHVFDVQNDNHREDIHNMFIYIANNTANYIT